MRSAAHRRDEDVPPEPPRDLAAEAAALIDRAGALLLELRAGPVTDRLIDELVCSGIRMADLTAALDAAAAGQFVTETAYARGLADGEARAASARPKVPRARHAAGGSFRPRLVQGVAAAAVLARHGFRNPLPHLQFAHHAAVAWTAGATAVLAGGALAVSAALPSTPAHGTAGQAAGTPAPAASIFSATPITVPSSLRIARTVTGPKLNANAASRNPLTVLAPASYVPPDAPPPDSPPTQDPQQQAPAAGALTADAATLDLGAAYAGQVTITAAGGPVSWGAVGGSRDIALDSARGTLQAGESAVVSITVAVSAQIPGGSTTLTLWPGRIVITVTWPALPVPAVDPSPADTSLPASP